MNDILGASTRWGSQMDEDPRISDFSGDARCNGPDHSQCLNSDENQGCKGRKRNGYDPESRYGIRWLIVWSRDCWRSAISDGDFTSHVHRDVGFAHVVESLVFSECVAEVDCLSSSSTVNTLHLSVVVTGATGFGHIVTHRLITPNPTYSVTNVN